MEEMEKKSNEKTSIRFTGYHAFYRTVAGQVKTRLPHSDLAAISKTAAKMWKECSSSVKEDWKREGQKLREDIDCGIVTYKCRRCSASFTRAKDAAYHEKRCEECQCTTCCKVFSSKLSLARHMNIHSAKYECETCHKTFATKHILVRHTKVHSKDKDFTCHSCNAKFKTKFSQERHEKNCK